MDHDRPRFAFARAVAVVALFGLTGLAVGGIQDAGGEPGAGPAAVDAPRAPYDPSADFHADYASGAVAADHPVASAAGAEMLHRGGNAVDAAVAASFCLSVVRPDSCGIGGGGFMLVHVPARGDQPAATHALDYREMAPAAVGPDYYEKLLAEGAADDVSRTGVHAVGVPGTVAGLLTAHARWGRLSRREVLEPAIRVAFDGWASDDHATGAAEGLEARIAASKTQVTGAAWLRRHMSLFGELTPGTTIRNPEQGRALQLIAETGVDAFYRGPIADAIVAVMEAEGGPITHADLDAYAPRDLEPVRATHAGRTIISFPPPSSGGIAILQILGVLERVEARDGPFGDAEDLRGVHVLIEAMKHAFADRATWLADPDFAEVPIDRLLAAETLDAMAERVSLERTGPPESYGTAPAPADDAGTSHLSVVDGDGMAVACTETINLGFGSLVPVPGFGFLLNDEMDDFTTRRGTSNAFGLRQSDDNLPSPGQRPLSSMSPTIALDADGDVEIVVGASGGPRIITGTLQVLLAALDPEIDPADAMTRPRFHHQWLPDQVQFEPRWVELSGSGPPDEPRPIAPATLGRFGHEVGSRDEVGNVQLIVRRDGRWHAVCDPRKGGRPAGR